ncbi:MAG TPA: hypothetical protein VN669_11810 [Candidatus Acidoferrales bacterium]|jgi:hypothetical protein|nr:hypothetical protein [Candidatus Acidoferrales bacterium]
MTLQTENGAPSFYTFPSFHPRRNALLYGVVLSLIAFCLVTLIFNYGIREKLWSYDSAAFDSSASPSSDSVSSSFSQTSVPPTIRVVTLPDSVLHSLEGAYFSAEMNRTYLITVDGQQIYLRIDHQPNTELIPISDDTLYAGEGHLIKFAVDSAERVDHIDLYDDGHHVIARRP